LSLAGIGRGAAIRKEPLTLSEHKRPSRREKAGYGSSAGEEDELEGVDEEGVGSMFNRFGRSGKTHTKMRSHQDTSVDSPVRSFNISADSDVSILAPSAKDGQRPQHRPAPSLTDMSGDNLGLLDISDINDTLKTAVSNISGRSLSAQSDRRPEYAVIPDGGGRWAGGGDKAAYNAGDLVRSATQEDEYKDISRREAGQPMIT